MLMVNIQTLPDRDYAKAIPNDYVINVKVIQMTKAVLQVAKRQESDRSKVYHINTTKFAETHPDATESSVAYITNPATGHVDLVAAAAPMPNLTEAITALTGRMLHHTQALAASMEAEQRKAKREGKKTEPAEGSEEVEASEEDTTTSETTEN